MIVTEIIETSIAYLEIKENILYVTMKEGADIDVEDVYEMITSRRNLQQGKKMLVLADITKVWQTSNEAREKASDKEFKELSIATAIITESLTTKLIANFYIKFNKPVVPTKMFKSKTKALEWLMTFK